MQPIYDSLIKESRWDEALILATIFQAVKDYAEVTLYREGYDFRRHIIRFNDARNFLFLTKDLTEFLKLIEYEINERIIKSLAVNVRKDGLKKSGKKEYIKDLWEMDENWFSGADLSKEYHGQTMMWTLDPLDYRRDPRVWIDNQYFNYKG